MWSTSGSKVASTAAGESRRWVVAALVAVAGVLVALGGVPVALGGAPGVNNSLGAWFVEDDPERAA